MANENQQKPKAATHIFTGNVNHDKKGYIKGQAVPEELIQSMVKKGLAQPIQKPLEPVAPPPAPFNPDAKE